MTPAGLRTFAHITSHGYRLGCSVRHLTLVGVLYDFTTLEGILEAGALSWLPTRGPGLRAWKQISQGELVTARTSFNELQQWEKDVDKFREATTGLILLSQAMQNLSSGPQPKLDTFVARSRGLQWRRDRRNVCEAQDIS